MKKLVGLVLALTLLSPIPSNANKTAKLSCKQVTAQTKKLFEGEYKGDPDKAFTHLGKQIVKAYTLSLNHKGCFTKKEINDIYEGIRGMKADCEKARKDEFTWALQKDLCAEYQKLYKYIK